MNKTHFIIIALAAVFTLLAYLKSPALAYEGATSAARLLVWVLPGLLAGLLLGGMIQVLLPREMVVAWTGEGSGIRGLAIATVAGMVTPGGPFVQFPLVASLWKAGAAVGPVTAYLSAWTLLGLQRIFIWEAPILGWKYTTARVLVCLLAPIILGTLTAWLYNRIAEI